MNKSLKPFFASFRGRCEAVAGMFFRDFEWPDGFTSLALAGVGKNINEAFLRLADMHTEKFS